MKRKFSDVINCLNENCGNECKSCEIVRYIDTLKDQLVSEESFINIIKTLPCPPEERSDHPLWDNINRFKNGIKVHFLPFLPYRKLLLIYGIAKRDWQIVLQNLTNIKTEITSRICGSSNDIFDISIDDVRSVFFVDTYFVSTYDGDGREFLVKFLLEEYASLILNHSNLKDCRVGDIVQLNTDYEEGLDSLIIEKIELVNYGDNQISYNYSFLYANELIE